MTTREEFELSTEHLVGAAVDMCRGLGDDVALDNERAAVMAAWDAQAAEVRAARTEMYRSRQDAYWARRDVQEIGMALRSEMERLRVVKDENRELRTRVVRLYAERIRLGDAQATGVPLTQENAARAWVVDGFDWNVWVLDSDGAWRTHLHAGVLSAEALLTIGGTVLAWRKP